MKSAIAIAALLAMIGCGASTPTPQARGESVEVEMRGGKTFGGELICLEDSVLYMISGSTLVLSLDQVSSVRLDSTGTRHWIVPSIIMFGVRGLLLPAFIPIRLIAGGVTSLIYESTEPQRTFPVPLTIADRNSLRLYARFPYGMGEAARTVLDPQRLLR